MFGVGQEVYMVARDVNHEGRTRNPRRRVLDEDGEPVEPPLFAEQRSDLAVVIPAWRLEQLLFEGDEVLRRREKGEKAWLLEHGEQ
jgi:hypothetical protein